MNTQYTVTATFIIVCLLGLVTLGLWGCPKYFVYSAQKDGEATLARAESSRRVAIAEANAKKESASLLAQADTIRAHGIARANQIIGLSLTDAYLHWFWIDNIDKSNNVIYVPTEANLPIMEAGRMLKHNTPPPAAAPEREEKHIGMKPEPQAPDQDH